MDIGSKYSFKYRISTVLRKDIPIVLLVIDVYASETFIRLETPLQGQSILEQGCQLQTSLASENQCQRLVISAQEE